METIKNQHFAEAGMLIKRPVAEVFEAFLNPEITKRFWFTRSTGRLKEGTRVTWTWEMYGVSTDVFVRKISVNEKIMIEWDEPSTSVDFNFTPLSDGSTFVSVRHYGFKQKGDDLIKEIRDSTGGFTTVLDGLKASLEHNIDLNLIADKFPKEIMQHGKQMES